MSERDTPAKVASNDQLGQVPERVKPRAWAIFVDNGNARMWSTLQPHVQKLADAEGLEVTRLYDQAAIDAAVAAERERWAMLLAGASRIAENNAKRADDCGMLSRALLDALKVLLA